MEEINNFQQEPDETLYHAWECFKELLMKCPQHYLTEMQEVILFYNGLDVPTRQILDSRGVVPTMTAADAKKAIQEMAKYSQKRAMGILEKKSWTSEALVLLKHNSDNLGREIKKRISKVPLIPPVRPFFLARAKLMYTREDYFEEFGGKKDYIELNDLNKPLELRRNQDDDLMPTIEEGEVIEEFRTRDKDLDTGIEDYPSYCDQDKKIHIDCAHNLKFSCMIGFEFVHVNFFPLLYVNVMSTKFHNSIKKDKMVYKGDNVVGALMNVPIFVGTFSVVMDFAIFEHMSAYRDKEMGDIIVGEPLLREVGINASRFDGMITIYNGNDEVVDP
ncbi:hypothetical protein Tco_1549073 [Tanacetum coccineum]